MFFLDIFGPDERLSMELYSIKSKWGPRILVGNGLGLGQEGNLIGIGELGFAGRRRRG
jgi:hypothetical protein